ncbi:GNAT family N-acetyltransferase [Halotia wernerae UHCC 0503]|nr:GNAT family N-acetyltransferase [Halotia wernerae UHCC 0503]
MNSLQIQFREQGCCDGGDRHFKIDLYQLQELFNISAFWAKGRSIKDLSIAIANSDPVISVGDGEQLIGFARATSDGIYRATIWDVVIHPNYRGTGLGSKLIETVLNHPRIRCVERVYIMTTCQQRFYEKIGFQPNSSNTMVLYRQSNLDSLAAEEIQLQESIVG